MHSAASPARGFTGSRWGIVAYSAMAQVLGGGGMETMAIDRERISSYRADCESGEAKAYFAVGYYEHLVQAIAIPTEVLKQHPGTLVACLAGVEEVSFGTLSCTAEIYTAVHFLQ